MKSHGPLSLSNQLISKFHFRRALRLEARKRYAAAHRAFASAARRNNVDAAYRLGTYYLQGLGCARSGSEAQFWFEVAAKAGCADAQFELGIALLADRDIDWCAGASARWAKIALDHGGAKLNLATSITPIIKRDDKLAFYWLHKAADGGKTEAKANLGWLLLKGVGCLKDEDAAFANFIEADQEQINQATFGLATIFGDKSSPRFDLAQHESLLKRAADLQNITAAFQFGLLLKKRANGPSDLEQARVYLLFASRMGHVEASFECGDLVLHGIVNLDDIEFAANLFRKAAKSGHLRACITLGDIYSRGDKIRPDLREAAHWYRRAADAGHVQSQFQLGCFFARGEGVPKDLINAVKYFELSAEGGHPTGAYNAGVFYDQGECVKQDYTKAIKLFKIAAAGSVAQAQIRLAQILDSGKAGIRDRDAAASLLEQAAKQNNPDARFALALMLVEDGDGQSLARIEELLCGAITEGHIGAAEFALSQPLELNRVSKAATAALEFIANAAEGGVHRAMVIYARHLCSGAYVQKNYDRAEKFLKSAANDGDPLANFELGVLYCKRKQLPDDILNGLKYYIRAAEVGHPVAQFNAGVMYLNGVGTEIDYSMANKFLAEAASQGLEQARSALNELGRRASILQKSA